MEGGSADREGRMDGPSAGSKAPRLLLGRWPLSLSAELTTIIVAVNFGLAALLFISFRIVWTRAELEVAQRRQWSLARGIAVQAERYTTPVVDEAGLARIVHTFMTYNETLDVHILDPSGKIVWSYTMNGCPATLQPVDLDLIRRFFAVEDERPDALYGPDPCTAGHQTVFSAAPLKVRGETYYLYVVLLNQRGVHIGNIMQGPAAIRAGLFCIVVIAMLASGIGGALVRATTARFARVMSVVRAVQRGEFTVQADESGRDELAALAGAVNAMSRTIAGNIEELRQKDLRRRELIANIWHDIRTPISGISALVQRLRELRMKLPSDGVELTERILANVDLLSRFLSELQMLGKLESGELEPKMAARSLTLIADDVLLAYGHTAEERGVELRLEADDTVPKVLVDDTMIARLLSNLIENALRYTPPGGRIAVVIRSLATDVEVEVIDTGSGIDPAELPRIFERSYQPKRSDGRSGSSGLGLAIVKQIVELHGSSISVNSTKGEGTRFLFTLTRADTASPGAAPAVVEDRRPDAV